ncbi:DNA primase family protein [Agrilactobacillus fermenti]|uniref:DNA primase family protein n=1 Tax=Agrilactobacillus fermenti TaxID=2586909 RepID=UPI003A5C7322
MQVINKKLQSNPTLNLATATKRTTKRWHNQEMTWHDFLKRLNTPTITQESQSEYFKASKGQRDAIKDVGGYVGGFLKEGRRKADMVQSRSLITLDADFPRHNLWEDVNLVFDSAIAGYSTHSYTKKNPRIRLIIPLKRLVTPDEYVPLARQVAQLFGMDNFDDTTYQPERLMYWPSHSIDADYFFEYQDGPLLDPDEILNQYEDWRDSSFWPVSSRESSVHAKQAKKAGNPLTKNGVVGAFNRTYDIKSAIDTFLSDIYEPTAHDDRYTYIPGTTTGGLVSYDDKFAYSHHGTDPTGDMLTNAFDLVRLHKFGSLDDKSKTDMAVTKLPSFKAMAEFALEDTNVRQEMDKAALGSAQVDFENTDDIQTERWLTYSQNGLPVVNTYSLAQVITEKVPMFFNGNEFLRYDQDSGIWLNDAENYIHGLLTRDYLKKLTKINLLRETVSAVQGLEMAHDKFPEGDLNKLVLANGVYDLKADTFETSFDPALHARVSYPVEYDAEAECPTFDGFLTWLVGTENKPFIYEWLGYLFYRNYPIQKMLFLLGPGGTGKSTLINIMQALIGEKAYSAVTLESLMTKQFAPSGLYQKTANFDSDAKPEYLNDGAVLKMLTGEDTFYADVKYGQPLVFHNFAKLTFAMNKLPAMRDFSGGLKRRTIIIKVNKKVTNDIKQKYPLSRILQELPGIFNQAMIALRRALEKRQFTLSESSEKDLADWIKSNDQVGRFIDEACEVGKDFTEKAEDLYLGYSEYSNDAGEKPLGKTNLYRRLEELGFEKSRIRIDGRRPYIWTGIRLRNDDFE